MIDTNTRAALRMEVRRQISAQRPDLSAEHVRELAVDIAGTLVRDPEFIRLLKGPTEPPPVTTAERERMRSAIIDAIAEALISSLAKT